MSNLDDKLGEILDKCFNDSVPGASWNKEIALQQINSLMISKDRIKNIMRLFFDDRKRELEKISNDDRTRAFAVAAEDLIYNYMEDVLDELNLKPLLKEEL